MYVYIYIWSCACIYVMYAHVHVYVYVYVCICLHVCLYACEHHWSCKTTPARLLSSSIRLAFARGTYRIHAALSSQPRQCPQCNIVPSILCSRTADWHNFFYAYDYFLFIIIFYVFTFFFLLSRGATNTTQYACSNSWSLKINILIPDLTTSWPT